MGRVDLDAVQARDERANKPPYSVRDIAESQADVADLVAELRVAREVVGHLPRTPCPFCGYGPHNHGCALAAYDRHVQHSDDPGSERDGE